MASLILHPERLERGTPDGVLAAPPHGTRRERLEVYINGYPARVQEAIEESYPAVTHVIGHRATHELVSRYVPALTQYSYNLNDVGAEVPRFLCHDMLAERFPFLGDLARLEWAVARAFHAEGRPALDPQPLATWTEEQWQHAVMQFQPSVAVVCSPWPISELWEARETPIEAIDIDLRDQPDQVLVYRVGYGVRCESISRDEALVLGALLSGHALGEVSELLGANGGDPASVSAWFARWMQNGLIAACTSNRREP
jgi:hypothetical protein